MAQPPEMPPEARDLARLMRSTARDIFLCALRECSIAAGFERNVECERGVLRVCDDLYDLRSYQRTFVVAMGKAAHPMAEELQKRIGSSASGIVASSVPPPGAQLPGLRYFDGGHPLPNEESMRAADAIRHALPPRSPQSLVIYLISGGASSIVERPIDEEISLEDLVATYRALVHCGAPIAEINAVRKHLSAVKGGRMAKLAAPAQQVSILVSDVPDGKLDALASGPTMPDTTTVEECYEIVRRYNLLGSFPASVRELFARRALEETPKPDDPEFHRCRWWPVLSSAVAQKAAEHFVPPGFAVEIDNRVDDWEYAKAADHLLGRVRELRQGAARVCLISGGEVTVEVKGKPGVGGRNQQFALYCAPRIAGENIAVLSAGTDGIDGSSAAAGAVADGTTMARAAALGLDAATSLATFNATPFFEQLDDLVVTGPTGNNVRDLRILLAY